MKIYLAVEKLKFWWSCAN